MPIKSITYKRIKNLGNYESKTLEATSIVNEGDDAARELEELIAFVESSLFPPKAATAQSQAETLEIAKRRGETQSSTDAEDTNIPPF